MRMMHPSTPHLIQNRAVEIRQSDGEKPQDSFIAKKNQLAQQAAKEAQNDQKRMKREKSKQRERESRREREKDKDKDKDTKKKRVAEKERGRK